MNDEIKIPSSKTKIFFLFLGALLFVVLGIWFVSDPERFANSIYSPRSSSFVQIVGLASLAFFGVCGVLAFKKLFDKKNGIIINQSGVLVNSVGPSVGLVRWDDITSIETVKVHSQKFIMIKVSNPEHYINLSKSKFKKMAMKANYAKYGSPISISANTLKVDFEALIEIFEKQYQKNVLN